MSKERSPRELCSTTIGTRGIRYSFSMKPWRASLLRPVGGSQRSFAHLEAHPWGPVRLERLAQDREVPEQAVAAVVGPREVERVEHLAARLGRHPRCYEQVARDDRMAAGVDVARVELMQLRRHERVEHHRPAVDEAEQRLEVDRLLV